MLVVHSDNYISVVSVAIASPMLLVRNYPVGRQLIVETYSMQFALLPEIALLASRSVS